MSDQETVTITKQEYEALLRDQRKLTALENNGVDNWDYYDEAMSEFRAGEQDSSQTDRS